MEKDVKKPFELLTKAADQNHIGSLILLGSLHRFSPTVTGFNAPDIISAPNIEKAKEFYRRGVELGNQTCRDLLSEISS